MEIPLFFEAIINLLQERGNYGHPHSQGPFRPPRDQKKGRVLETRMAHDTKIVYNDTHGSLLRTGSWFS